ncbi:hypothetical protein JW930_01620 [Candidatus Woesearchaeota archaeon]|nr:hypothetical protein [Candidatus Woesearchaeota archaeon]
MSSKKSTSQLVEAARHMKNFPITYDRLPERDFLASLYVLPWEIRNGATLAHHALFNYLMLQSRFTPERLYEFLDEGDLERAVSCAVLATTGIETTGIKDKVEGVVLLHPDIFDVLAYFMIHGGYYDVWVNLQGEQQNEYLDECVKEFVKGLWPLIKDAHGGNGIIETKAYACIDPDDNARDGYVIVVNQKELCNLWSLLASNEQYQIDTSGIVPWLTRHGIKSEMANAWILANAHNESGYPLFFPQHTDFVFLDGKKVYENVVYMEYCTEAQEELTEEKEETDYQHLEAGLQKLAKTRFLANALSILKGSGGSPLSMLYSQERTTAVRRQALAYLRSEYTPQQTKGN